MARSHLLQKAMRNLGIIDLVNMKPDEIDWSFRMARWPQTNGEPVCPHCKPQCEAIYRDSTRQRFKCQMCEKSFSVFTGTYLAASKLTKQELYFAAYHFVTEPKGYCAIRASHHLKITYEAAEKLLRYFRQSLVNEAKDLYFSGRVQIDGVYVGGYIKPKNYIWDREDRCKKKEEEKNSVEGPQGKKYAVVSITQKNGRTYSEVFQSEAHAVPMIRSRVRKGSVICSDLAGAWNGLRNDYILKQVNHAQMYAYYDARDREWLHVNRSETYNSRLRRGEMGVYHHISQGYLPGYASEAAWKQDFRKASIKARLDLFLRILLRPVDSKKIPWLSFVPRRKPSSKQLPSRSSRTF